MVKIGRNQPCPCGSGKKFKHCHGAPNETAAGSSNQYVLPIEIQKAIASSEAERKAFILKHGAVRDVLSTEFGDWRFVATGKRLHYGKNWRLFTDFLSAYLAGCIGKEWGQRQAKLPVDQQHPVVQWHTYIALGNQGLEPDHQGRYGSSLGAANAWFRLAYDLYLIEHNVQLHKRLIRRLREPSGFQGARFEAAVAAMMLASGYDLRFADEKGPGKHPEFYGTHKQTGQVLAIEAKSKHRSGILGFKPGSPLGHQISLKIDRLLYDAVNKDTETPLLVFIEVNVPLLLTSQSAHEIYRDLNASWASIQNRIWKSGFPSIGVVFYNDISPWYLREPLPEGGKTIWAAVLWPYSSRHSFDAKPLLKNIGEGCIQRCNIPLEFPQEPPSITVPKQLATCND